MPTKHQKKLFSKQEMDDINDAISKQAVNFPVGLSAVNMPTYASLNFTTSAAPSNRVVEIQAEDVEMRDVVDIRNAIESMMDTLYPPFEPEIVHAPSKDYFLPALKVLVYMDGKYFSPQQQAEWKGMELEAECIQSPWHFGRPTMVDIVGFETPAPHSAPKEDCDCGIYGSVNLEEVSSYLVDSSSPLRGHWIANYGYEPKPIVRKKLCVIEPSPGAKVVVCRKGWKASGAFISEIVGETVSQEDASNLLSIAWHREIDIRRLERLHENR